MTLFWRRKKIPSTATATTCCHHYHEEQTQTDFYLQNSVPKLFFKLKTQSHLQAYMEASSKYTHPQCQAPSTTLWHFLQWNFQHHEPIQPFLVCRSAHNPWINKTQKPRPPKLMTTPPLSPRQPPTSTTMNPQKKFIPQSNQTHIKIWIQGNKQSIKLRKRNKIYFERFRISEAFLSSISSSINSVASLALITATKAQIATTASARSGLGFGHCWTRWWPTMAYATQSQRDVVDGETDAKRERETWEIDV